MDLSKKEKLSSFHLWKRRKFYKLYTKGTWESPSASTVQDNVYIGLESMKTSGKWLKHAQHVNTIATGTKTATPTKPSTRTPMATHRCWLLHIWWIWIFSHHWLLHQNGSHNGPQFASHQFTKFAKEWNFDHNNSSPRNQEIMDKLKQLSRLQRVSSPVPNTQGRIPTLPCWHTGVHPLMPTFTHQLRHSTRE